MGHTSQTAPRRVRTALPSEQDAFGFYLTRVMPSPAEPLDLSTLKAPPPVQWRSWPVRESIPAAVVLLGGLLAAGIGVRWLTDQMHLAFLGAAVLALAMWRFFVPTLFELNTEGVNLWLFARHRRIPWSEVRRYEVRSSGVLLLPHAEPCPLAAFRGLFLPWGEHRDEVLAQVRYYLDRSPKQ